MGCSQPFLWFICHSHSFKPFLTSWYSWYKGVGVVLQNDRHSLPAGVFFLSTYASRLFCFIQN